MDPSTAMIKEAERITDESKIDNIVFMESSAEKLADVEDGSADCIVSGEAAHWFDMNKVGPEIGDEIEISYAIG